nr:Uncharacterised protein [Klebsiella pneumoniae]
MTTARNMELMYQLYAFCSSQPALKAVMQNWMRRSQQTLSSGSPRYRPRSRRLY